MGGCRVGAPARWVLSLKLTCPSCCSNSCSHIPPTCDAMHDSAVHRSLDFHKWGVSTCCCCCRRVHTRPGNGSFRDLWSCFSTVCRVSFCAGLIFGFAMEYAVFVANIFSVENQSMQYYAILTPRKWDFCYSRSVTPKRLTRYPHSGNDSRLH